ncbi:MAG: glycine cleavage system aminomethyltransferase GcvT, partial [Opitutaceae bacterium]|nr:glycine cleavage system aminomethyltransferase GcvT [Opitutaceae bacterium]
NASNTAADLAHFRRVAEGFDAAVTDRSAGTASLALQGPLAAASLQPLTDAALSALRYYHFTEGQVAGVPALIARTGYTGEDGFELYHSAGDAARLAEALVSAGEAFGLRLAGLGARDSLRLEAGFPLHGHELSGEISPVAAGLGWTVKFSKPDAFIGRAALEKERREGSARKVLYFRTGDRRIPRHGTAVVALEEGVPAGSVLSGTLSPVLNEAICSALVAAPFADAPLAADIRGTLIPLRRVTPPFVPLRKR